MFLVRYSIHVTSNIIRNINLFYLLYLKICVVMWVITMKLLLFFFTLLSYVLIKCFDYCPNNNFSYKIEYYLEIFLYFFESQIKFGKTFLKVIYIPEHGYTTINYLEKKIEIFIDYKIYEISNIDLYAHDTNNVFKCYDHSIFEIGIVHLCFKDSNNYLKFYNKI